MKEINIKIIINEDEIKTLVSKNGLTNDSSGILEFIGVLENLKNLELEKLKKTHNIKLNNKEIINDGEDTIIF